MWTSWNCTCNLLSFEGGLLLSQPLPQLFQGPNIIAQWVTVMSYLNRAVIISVTDIVWKAITFKCYWNRRCAGDLSTPSVLPFSGSSHQDAVSHCYKSFEYVGPQSPSCFGERTLCKRCHESCASVWAKWWHDHLKGIKIKRVTTVKLPTVWLGHILLAIVGQFSVHWNYTFD